MSIRKISKRNEKFQNEKWFFEDSEFSDTLKNKILPEEGRRITNINISISISPDDFVSETEERQATETFEVLFFTRLLRHNKKNFYQRIKRIPTYYLFVWLLWENKKF